MERLFFDTSALVKRYYQEDGTEAVDALVEDDSSEVVITSLSVIETASAFRRKRNRDEIDPEDVDRLLGSFFDEALADFAILPMDESLSEFSLDLVLDDDLRTLDSLQLSAALSLVTADSAPRFVCADSDLVSVADRHGIGTVNPAEDSV